ncbi:MAG: helix-turn-helix transcriptional regulator [bacterium]|nr:helix-turn-helix transcriptional regulator [bacterium]
MDIGSVIRTYRKEIGLTQEEMANRLGVSTPAVNKWENGNSNPDIELLAPIARLLHISLDTLMSFHEELTDAEIEDMIRKIDKMFSDEGYEKTYEWALHIIKEYPNCNRLIWQLAVMLDARRLLDGCEDPDKYDEQINAWYELVLNDEDEKIQHQAADSLFSFYLRKQNFEMAEKYLNYFSDHDPMKKICQGRLYKEQGKKQEAYESFESVIFSQYNTLNLAFSMMVGLALEEDMEYARFLAEKMGTIAGAFDMGKYNECSAMLNVVFAEKNVEGTYRVAEQLLNNVDSIYDFPKSKLYQHMKFRDADASYIRGIKEELQKGFRDEEEFGYMKGYEPWERLMNEDT